MKKHLLIVLLLFISVRSFALHIAGGEFYYSYVGPNADSTADTYKVTLRLFRECTPVVPQGQTAALMPTEVEIGIYTNTAFGGSFMQSKNVPINGPYDVITLSKPLTCILNPPVVCYQIGYFTFMVDLPKQQYGYTIAFQTCCRSFSIQNIRFFDVPGQNTLSEGATYTCTIPGTNVLGNKEVNSSAIFAVKDTVLVCQQKKITLDFSATDPDTNNPQYQDSLSYSFCAAYNRGDATSSADVVPSDPPYATVSYNNGFSGNTPLGNDVVIDPKTGIITGTIGAAGGYVVNVCVAEWRHGQIISIHRKDFLLRVASCDFPQANLSPSYVTCDGFNLSFQNLSTSANINSYYWTFGDTTAVVDTSINPTPTHTYRDTGVYVIKLVVNKGQTCTDSAIALAGVYPGFTADFSVIGNCIQNPYQFYDQSATKYGYVNTWTWDFGDGTGVDSVARPDTSHLYAAIGKKNVVLTVTNSKGCRDSVTKVVDVEKNLGIILPFRDTLICIKDTLQLSAGSSAPAQFTWSPNYNIINPSSAKPFVYPDSAFTYTVFADDGHGCTNTDSVLVNVAKFAYINLPNDTTICLGDTSLINPQTNALYFTWSPPSNISSRSVIDPSVWPQNITLYSVHASISPKCQADASITIKEVPYPISKAGPDVSVCYGKNVQLKGTENGSSFTWSPTNTLYQANTLTPLAGPLTTTTYTLAVYDTLGCPKPGLSYTTVQVIPPVKAFAGDDTSIVVNQPLQLNATGATSYTWRPTTGLNNPNTGTPIALFTNSALDSIVYTLTASTPEGCLGYANVTVHIYQTDPEIFVPSAFTPNGDATNDIIKPIVAGMKQFNYFRIYNRWGNMLFSSADQYAGWDGNYGGKPQPPDTYVYVAQAIAYTGRTITKRGTVVLVR